MRLTAYLLSRLLITGIVILVFAILSMMYLNHQRAVEEIDAASNAMLRILALQSIGLRQGIGLEPRFPDWYPVTQVSLPDGACVLLRDSTRQALNTTCRGKVRADPIVPQWFSWLYQKMFGAGAASTKEFAVRDKVYYLEIVPEADIEVAIVWDRIKLAVALTTGVLVLLGLMTALSIQRALHPVASIVDALARMKEGALDSTLGVYKFRELNEIAFACNSLANSLREEKAQRDALFQRIQTIQEDERRMIALELHDEFGQYLAAISANAVALHGAEDFDTVQSDAKRIQSNVERLNYSIKNLLQKLRPHPSGGENVVDMVGKLIDETDELHGDRFALNFETIGEFKDIPMELCTAVYRIAQEALTNIEKHANATKVTVTLVDEGDLLTLSVRDDGDAGGGAQLRDGYGFTGMKERAVALGGKTEISAQAGEGLTVTAKLPYGLVSQTP